MRALAAGGAGDVGRARPRAAARVPDRAGDGAADGAPARRGRSLVRRVVDDVRRAGVHDDRHPTEQRLRELVVDGENIALSGGRILYERLLSERRFTGELILRPLAGGRERKLAHFPERRRRIGDLDLDATRATWADRPVRRGYEAVPRGPGRIVVRRL